jgi:NADH-dependent peroxiredoxin subunit C
MQINQTIPDMKLEVFHENEIKKVNLSDYRNKWLIVFFYPADFTFVCPTELKEMASHYPEFQKENAEVLSISTDTVFAHKAWHSSSKTISEIKFPMGADPAGKICKEFGTYIEEGADEGLSLRGTFIIDPDGVLKAIEINNNDIGRSASELFRKLQAAIFTRKNGGEVCPASWVPGKKTLKPGLDLVGKI